MKLRAATAADLEAVTAIYRQSVETSAASFEITAPDAGEMERRWRLVTAAGCPYVVAEDHDTLLGFAYARPFHERAAFAWTVEDSVYVAPGHARRGIGRALLAELVERSAKSGFRQMIALISSDADAASVPLHTALGFTVAGRLAAVGFKQGRWHDIVHMQRPLGAGETTVPHDVAG